MLLLLLELVKETLLLLSIKKEDSKGADEEGGEVCGGTCRLKEDGLACRMDDSMRVEATGKLMVRRESLLLFLFLGMTGEVMAE